MAYITPQEAFALSGCDAQHDFMEKLNRRLQEGLPSKSRLNKSGGSPLEDTPPETWIEGKLAFDGSVFMPRSERLRPEDRNTAIGVIVIGDNIIWRVPRYNARLLRTDFFAARAMAPDAETTDNDTPPLKRPLNPDDRRAVKKFLRTHKHKSIKSATEDAQNYFKELALNEHTIRKMRKDLGLKGFPGKHSRKFLINLIGCVRIDRK